MDARFAVDFLSLDFLDARTRRSNRPFELPAYGSFEDCEKVRVRFRRPPCFSSIFTNPIFSSHALKPHVGNMNLAVVSIYLRENRSHLLVGGHFTSDSIISRRL